MEHENITVQFMAARMQKLMSGGWPGGGVPYGYVSVNKELVVVPEAADLVRLIYQKYLELDMKLNTVVGWLNKNGYKRVVKGERIKLLLRILFLRCLEILFIME